MQLRDIYANRLGRNEGIERLLGDRILTCTKSQKMGTRLMVIARMSTRVWFETFDPR
ncbi:hypothetical protein Bca101_008711 [Brassica carinata]